MASAVSVVATRLYMQPQIEIYMNRAITLVVVCTLCCIGGIGANAAPSKGVVTTPDEVIIETPSSPFRIMLKQVYETNPKLNAERRTLNIADEKVSQANGGYRPTVTADLATGRQGQQLPSQSWQYGSASSGQLVLTQPIFNGFGTDEQKSAAETRVKAGRARLVSIEQSTLLTAITDWMELAEKERVLKLTRANQQLLGAYYDATIKRFEAGDMTVTEVAQAESRYAQADARMASAIAARDAVKANFTRDTGMDAPVADFPPLPPMLPQNQDQAISLAQASPELLQAEQEEFAAKHDIGNAESALWPKVYIRGNMGEERAPFLGLDKYKSNALTLNVSIPLYQGGGEYSKIREAKLAHQRSREVVLDTSRGATERAQIAWANFNAAQSVIQAATRALDAAGRALKGVEEEQRQGMRTLTELLDEQAERLNAQITETSAQKNLRVEAYRLLAATGKLTASDLNLTDTPYNPVTHHDAVTPLWVGTTPRNEAYASTGQQK